MPTIYWTLPNNLVSSNGIGITGDNTFQSTVQTALVQINQTPSGHQLLTQILAKLSPLTLTIAPGTLNQCRTGNQKGWTKLTVAIKKYINSTGPDEAAAKQDIISYLGVALLRANRSPSWFATQLQNTPNYVIRGAPATAPSNLAIQATDIANWLHFRQPFPTPMSGDQLNTLLKNIQIVITRMNGQRPNAGFSCAVSWNPARTTSTQTNGVVETRPINIALAHELVHAYYSLYGLQLSNNEDSGGVFGVLYEYMAVGLGPWQNAPISENAVRRDAGIPLRLMY